MPFPLSSRGQVSPLSSHWKNGSIGHTIQLFVPKEKLHLWFHTDCIALCGNKNNGKRVSGMSLYFLNELLGFDVVGFTLTQVLVSHCWPGLGFLTKGICLWIIVELVCLWQKWGLKTSYPYHFEMLVFFVCLYIFFPKLLHKCENTQCVYFCFMCMCV